MVYQPSIQLASGRIICATLGDRIRVKLYVSWRCLKKNMQTDANEIAEAVFKRLSKDSMDSL